MDYIHYVFNILFLLFTYVVIMKIYMWVANLVGEQLGIGKFFINLCQKEKK
jgi:hypothetical protein